MSLPEDVRDVIAAHLDSMGYTRAAEVIEEMDILDLMTDYEQRRFRAMRSYGKSELNEVLSGIMDADRAKREEIAAELERRTDEEMKAHIERRLVAYLGDGVKGVKVIETTPTMVTYKATLVGEINHVKMDGPVGEYTTEQKPISSDHVSVDPQGRFTVSSSRPTQQQLMVKGPDGEWVPAGPPTPLEFYTPSDVRAAKENPAIPMMDDTVRKFEAPELRCKSCGGSGWVGVWPGDRQCSRCKT